MIRLKIETVSEKLRNRAYMFTCTYKTAWNNHMEKDEKEGFKFEDVIIYMRTHKGFMDSEWKFR